MQPKQGSQKIPDVLLLLQFIEQVKFLAKG